jgi:biotin-dependent carboxylase-like uncharacterized protein
MATVQDWGRYGFQDRGVPVSGAMDREALCIANLLVGNPPGEAAVEITLGGFVAEFLDRVAFAMGGADLGARMNGAPLPGWVQCTAQAGDTLAMDCRHSGCRAYLALAGGIEVPLVMGSKSTYLRGGFGGYRGRRLQSGDVLECGASICTAGSCRMGAWGGAAVAWPSELIPTYSDHPNLRVVPGPQAELVTEAGWARFLSCAYRLTDRSDRMGCVLSGPAVTHRLGADIISDGTAFGSVQVPGNGQPIVLMADRQTIGGYAKIATTASFDLPLLAQLLPGDTVRFSAIDLWEAREIHLRREYRVRRAMQRLRGEKA